MDLENPDSLPCCCSWIRKHSILLRSDSDSENLAIALEDLQLPRNLQMLRSANANSTYYYIVRSHTSDFSTPKLPLGRLNMAFHEFRILNLEILCQTV